MHIPGLYITILTQLACLTELTAVSHTQSDELTRHRRQQLVDNTDLRSNKNNLQSNENIWGPSQDKYMHLTKIENMHNHRKKRDTDNDKNQQNKKNANSNSKKTIDTSTSGNKLTKIPGTNTGSKENNNEMSNEIPYTGEGSIKQTGLEDTCPLSCECGTVFSRLSKRALYSLECTGLQLKQLPESIPQNIQLLKLPSNRIDLQLLGSLRQLSNLAEVHLEANHIYTLQNWELLSPTLHYLVLDSNEIDYLANSTFIGVSNLLYFSSSHNRIEVIHKNAFAGLHKLEVLILTANRISEINVRWFRNLQSLRKLHLGGNNIHTLSDLTLQNLLNLQTLDLSDNHLHTIHPKAFAGLRQLTQLYLQENSIHVLPNSALQSFSLCDTIDLSRNYITVMDPYTFYNVNVTHLKLNQMRGLQLIDIHAFVNLRYLKYLEIIDNSDLIYIDREAFINVPKLETLSIFRNALNTVEKKITDSLPSLKTIDLHSNPLYCDCAMLWISDKVDLEARNLSVLNVDKTKCHLPQERTGITVNHPTLKSLPKLCSPRILPLFKTQYNSSLGDSFKISCKATSIPLSKVTWYLPSNHKRKLDKQIARSGERNSNVRHGEQLPSDRLVIDFAERKDGGNYTCIAQNTVGIAQSYTHINILLSSAYLIISKLTSTSVTVTWARTHHSRDYELVYRRGNLTYDSVRIAPYMREYTVSGLLPSTQYILCIAVSFSDKHIPINCSSVTTRDVHYMSSVLHSSRNFVISGAISVLVCIVIIICVVGHFSRRYNKKKERESKLYTDSLSQLYPASLDSISDTTPITYENRIAEMFDLEEGEMPTTSHRTTSLTHS